MDYLIVQNSFIKKKRKGGKKREINNKIFDLLNKPFIIS